MVINKPKNMQKSSLVKRTPRVALVTNILSHYRVPCFQELNSSWQGKVTFFTMAKEMQHRHYVFAQYNHNFSLVSLKSFKWNRHPYDDILLSNIAPIVFGKYDIIILGGWSEPTYLLLWIWGLLSRKHMLLWCESTAFDKRRTNKKEIFKKVLMRGFDGCIVPGIRSREYCRRLGMPDQQIYSAPNASDRKYFQRQAKRLVPLRSIIRAETDLSRFTVLVVARLEQRFKDISTLFRALRKLQNNNHHTTLLVAGDGSDQVFYQKLTSDLQLVDVRFLGTLDHDKLCRYYAASDVLVLPSRSETWGFVLNEAMEFGLPLIVSDAVGAGPDLVKNGGNGFIFPAGDSSTLAKCLNRLLRDEALRMKMGLKSLQIVENFSPKNWANGVKKAILSLCSSNEVSSE